jgi:hypothetical protein
MILGWEGDYLETLSQLKESTSIHRIEQENVSEEPIEINERQIWLIIKLLIACKAIPYVSFP